MSDFLVSMGASIKGSQLLRLLRQAYPAESAPTGESFDLPWGSVAVLHDPIQNRQNVVSDPRSVTAWVGDLVSVVPATLSAELDQWQEGNGTAFPSDLRSHRLMEALNGAYAVLVANQRGLALVTDPLGTVQIYQGLDAHERIVAFGTHPDLVAVLARPSREIDPVSAFEFLNNGTPCFPHTLHPHVIELGPGRCHLVLPAPHGETLVRTSPHWTFPDEYQTVPPEPELAHALSDAFRAAVADRSRGRNVAVTLSGGLDSRVIIASVPPEERCSAFTFADVMNREARTARAVAECYRRDWIPLYRDPDYIARTALETIRFTGCEGDWVNAHAMGFAREFTSRGMGAVLTGLLMNNILRGYYAADMVRVARAGRLLPARFEFVPFDYPRAIAPFDASAFPPALLEASIGRRRSFMQDHPGLRRQSQAEWLDGYPFSQASDNTAWVAERRVMPVRLPAMDRRVLNLACRVPMRTKAEGRMFGRMSRTLLGAGARIPNANDGVRPGSSHISTLLQKSARRTADRGKKLLANFGVKFPVPHSWHDYQRYWNESPGLTNLIENHLRQLDPLEGPLFTRSPAGILKQPAVHWLYRFRMVQLASWRSLLGAYRVHA